jgi:phage baseplate assembly protein W
MTRNTRTFTDLDAAFTRNPRTRDVASKSDEAAIRNSLRNLIHTRNYERPFQPDLGCQLHSLMFESLTPVVTTIAERTIITVINKYEPRVELLEVQVSPNQDENALEIEILFKLRNTEEPLRFNTTFTRVR